jgi:hypothetical protein
MAVVLGLFLRSPCSLLLPPTRVKASSQLPLSQKVIIPIDHLTFSNPLPNKECHLLLLREGTKVSPRQARSCIRSWSYSLQGLTAYLGLLKYGLVGS